MLNKLCLGTVQLGLKYGINNSIGRQPTQVESFSLLQTAIKNGIRYFDTASVYGNAENLLGDFGIGGYDVNIISKLKLDLTEIDNSVEETVEKMMLQSLKRLKVEKLNGFLLHTASDFYNSAVMKALTTCRENGLVDNIGVSVYEPEDALNVVRSGLVDYIQIPYSVFDQRLDQTDFFELAERNHVVVFARSAFLQGLLLMDVDSIPAGLSIAKPYLQQFNKIIEEHGYSRSEAAFLFCYLHKGISKVVFGVETEAQLKSNLDLLEKIYDFEECYRDLYGKFKSVEIKVITPSLWGV